MTVLDVFESGQPTARSSSSPSPRSVSFSLLHSSAMQNSNSNGIRDAKCACVLQSYELSPLHARLSSARYAFSYGDDGFSRSRIAVHPQKRDVAALGRSPAANGRVTNLRDTAKPVASSHR